MTENSPDDLRLPRLAHSKRQRRDELYGRRRNLDGLDRPVSSGSPTETGLE